MASIKIAISNESIVLNDSEVLAAIGPLQKQISDDFYPIWGVDADLSFVPKGTPPPPKTWQIGIFDNSDQAGALGYHDLTKDGLPLGKVFAGTDMEYQSAWTVTASHELLEMLVDPDINLYAFLQDGMEISFYAYEVCDPCETDRLGYKIDGILVSDFVYPAWFEAFQHVEGTEFDKQGHIAKPFEILKEGYMSVFDVSYNNAWYQRYPAGAKINYQSRPAIGSRRERRGTPRDQWLRSKPSRKPSASPRKGKI